MINNLLDRIEGVQSRGTGSWIAKCPAHDDHYPSLAIREVESGRVLIHCFAGCPPADILSAVGLDWGDVFPPREIEMEDRKKERTLPSFPWPDFLARLRNDLMTVMIGTSHIVRGNTLTKSEYMLLMETALSIHAAIEEIKRLEEKRRTWNR